MSTKIQINSLEALERLIGNDNELEIELRNSIVQEFTKKYLKALANDILIQEAVESVVEEIRKEYTKKVKDGWSGKVVLNEKALNELKGEFEYMFKLELRSLVSEVVEENKSKEKIETAINQASKRITNELSEQLLEKRLEDLVNKKLREKLGL